MAVTKIKFLEEVDNRPDENRGWDSLLNQGETVTNYRVYEITNDDGSTQYVKLEVIINSYGSEEGAGDLVLTKQTTKTVKVWA